MLTLAAESSVMSEVWKSAHIVGPIGAFIVLTVTAFVVLYMRIIQPELKASRDAAKENLLKYESIAKSNAESASNLKDLSENLLEGQANNTKHHEYLVAQREFFGKLISERAGR